LTPGLGRALGKDHRCRKITGCPVEEWDEGDHYETLAICRSLALARAAFASAVAEKPAAQFMIRSRIRVVKRHSEGDW